MIYIYYQEYIFLILLIHMIDPPRRDVGSMIQVRENTGPKNYAICVFVALNMDVPPCFDRPTANSPRGVRSIRPIRHESGLR
jgi:hypothetical protein